MNTAARMLYAVRKAFALVAEYTQDVRLFAYHNSYSPFVDRRRRGFYRLIIESHAIEKGLSLAEPRPMFGREKIGSILSGLGRYDASHSHFPVGMADGALKEYYFFNTSGGAHDGLLSRIEKRISSVSENDGQFTGGVRRYSNGEGVDESAVAFLTTRRSLRMFNPAAVPIELIERAIRIAQQCPSQCNRQASKVHFYQDTGTIQALLKLQGGSSGFSHMIGNLLLVTNEISAWGGPQQRNQLYVDGALFSMQLILATHALGLGSCPLNLAVPNRIERQIKRVGGVPASERTIMMIAVGKPMDGDLKVARSPRRDISEIARFH